MPFPSRGCQVCRTRRIKCDCRVDKKGCERCEKSGWTCPGYTDAADLIFRNETTKVAKRALRSRGRGQILLIETGADLVAYQQAVNTTSLQWDTHASGSYSITRTTRGMGMREGANNTPPKSPSAVADANFASPRISCRPQDPRQSTDERRHVLGAGHVAIAWPAAPPPLSYPSASLLPTLDELSDGYFFYRYVFDTAQTTSDVSVTHGNGCLLASVRALGVVGLRSSSRGPSVSPEAWDKYVHAIDLTQRALERPSQAHQDSTLMAIYLLSIFESTTAFHSDLAAWRGHINGPSALLDLRGPEQFHTRTGSRLFFQIAFDLVTACVHCHQAVPPHMWQIVNRVRGVPGSDDFFWRLLNVSLRFADLFSCVDIFTHAPLSDPLDVVLTALEIEHELVDIVLTAPEEWRFANVYIGAPSVFGKNYHHYNFYLPAQIHNMIRSYRILQNEILASVPQHLSGASVCKSESDPPLELASRSEIQLRLWANFGSRDHSSYSMATQSVKSNLPFVRLSGGYNLHWSLYIAGVTDAPGGEVRGYALKTLQVIGRAVGIQQALIFAKMLPESESVHGAQQML